MAAPLRRAPGSPALPSPPPHLLKGALHQPAVVPAAAARRGAGSACRQPLLGLGGRHWRARCRRARCCACCTSWPALPNSAAGARGAFRHSMLCRPAAAGCLVGRRAAAAVATAAAAAAGAQLLQACGHGARRVRLRRRRQLRARQLLRQLRARGGGAARQPTELLHCIQALLEGRRAVPRGRRRLGAGIGVDRSCQASQLQRLQRVLLVRGDGRQHGVLQGQRGVLRARRLQVGTHQLHRQPGLHRGGLRLGAAWCDKRECVARAGQQAGCWAERWRGGRRDAKKQCCKHAVQAAGGTSVSSEQRQRTHARSAAPASAARPQQCTPSFAGGASGWPASCAAGRRPACPPRRPEGGRRQQCERRG